VPSIPRHSERAVHTSCEIDTGASYSALNEIRFGSDQVSRADAAPTTTSDPIATIRHASARPRRLVLA
jgi:hypothetical protein